MNYLYLNFFDRLNAKNLPYIKDQQYTTSLTEQYEVLRPRLGKNAPQTLQEFIEMFFPGNNVEKDYEILLPALERNVSADQDKMSVYNVFIRPRNRGLYGGILPHGSDLFLVGDIFAGKNIIISVKGIEILDASASRLGEYLIRCGVQSAFTGKALPNSTKQVPSFQDLRISTSALTLDIIRDICDKSWPVRRENMHDVAERLDDLTDYLNFRTYYLGLQSEKSEKTDNVTVCNAFRITKDAYLLNEKQYKDYLLDGNPEFCRGDQVILNEAVDGAEEFPLIRVDIEKNRMQILQDKGKNNKPKYEGWLNRYSNDSVGLASKPVSSKKNMDSSALLYRLGDRFLFTHVDLDVDCSELENKLQSDMAKSDLSIELQYEGRIKSEVDSYVNSKKSDIEKENRQKHEDYEKELNSSLKHDVEENADEEVKSQYAAKVKAERDKLNASYNSRLSYIDDKIKSFYKDKEKAKGDEERLEKIESDIKTLEKERDDVNARISENAKMAESSVSLESLYIERNNRLLKKRETGLSSEENTTLESHRKERHKILADRYAPDMDKEKRTARGVLQSKFEEARDKKIEEETIRRYSMYYRPQDDSNFAMLQKRITRESSRYLAYDDTPERIKLERQIKALNDLKTGNVKNPYLATYLFEPKALEKIDDADMREPEWILPTLNESQKLAVKRALASKGLFLLQGPPGTGKTQVIAEITAQLVKEGKKVLISSETHKAIDNVFERLPKVSEIRPLRLIPNQSEKLTNYGIEKLTDNFYENISGKLEKRIKRMESFDELASSFGEEKQSLNSDYGKLLKLKGGFAETDEQKKDINSKINDCNTRIQGLRDNLDSLNAQSDIYKRTKTAIDLCNFRNDEDDVSFHLMKYQNKLKELLAKYEILKDVSVENVCMLIRADLGKINEEISVILASGDKLALLRKREELKSKIKSLRGEDGDEPEPGAVGYDEFLTLRRQLIEINNSNDLRSFDYASTCIGSFLPDKIPDEETIDGLPDEILSFKSEQRKAAEEIKSEIDKTASSIVAGKIEIEKEIADIRLEKNGLETRLSELGEDDAYVKYDELDRKIRDSVAKFFKDFDVDGEYEPGDYETAFRLIDDKSKHLREQYDREKSENDKRAPVYRNICRYLEQKEILDQDRERYTQDLYDKVNVFGITCTSRDRYTDSNNEGLKRYGIKEVDVKKQGIDVVIVDEVSKSFFLDLVIPILYGKTVILVGDHRQLPPMYDLRFLRKSDFETMDESIVTKTKNDHYTEIYERCVFKDLFEDVPENYRVTLKQQYRCHSHIMNVFNFFYDGTGDRLRLGTKNQDELKAHNLSVYTNGRNIIDPKYHVYFVNCDEEESSENENSTSKNNPQEAAVAVELLNLLNKASLQEIKKGKIKKGAADGSEDTRPSVGVICTYGDQARLIKRSKKGRNFYEGFSQKQDEGLVISTVDDFQGDERDIIIVSMVRNTSNKHARLDFITRFERINVAFSRARKMLIILGSKKFLTEKGIIDLPNMEGRHELDKSGYPVYKDIIDSIDKNGKILEAEDIIGDGK